MPITIETRDGLFFMHASPTGDRSGGEIYGFFGCNLLWCLRLQQKFFTDPGLIVPVVSVPISLAACSILFSSILVLLCTFPTEASAPLVPSLSGIPSVTSVLQRTLKVEG